MKTNKSKWLNTSLIVFLYLLLFAILEIFLLNESTIFFSIVQFFCLSINSLLSLSSRMWTYELCCLRLWNCEFTMLWLYFIVVFLCFYVFLFSNFFFSFDCFLLGLIYSALLSSTLFSLALLCCTCSIKRRKVCLLQLAL